MLQLLCHCQLRTTFLCPFVRSTHYTARRAVLEFSFLLLLQRVTELDGLVVGVEAGDGAGKRVFNHVSGMEVEVCALPSKSRILSAWIK